MKRAFVLFVTVAVILSLDNTVQADNYTNYLAIVRARRMEEERLNDKKREQERGQAKVESDIAYLSALTALIQAQTKTLNEKTSRVNEFPKSIDSYRTQTTNLESTTNPKSNGGKEYIKPIEDGKTFWRRTILEKYKVISPDTIDVSELIRVYGELGRARENKTIYKLPEGWYADNTKPFEDGQVYWRKALLEKHKVVPPTTAALPDIMRIYGELNEVQKSGVDYKLPDGWSRVTSK